ncbi:U-box domain-containing protein kinase family protein [Rhynchospora pubera]|uniref:RING-type E3 ubiquitin transferase n=1 Tax=Rhynchospora pubera TaxID=906938 RepID=A0AAV8FVG9_9POAL|nr:U-box domain-containing protein kinase family protein [Rhynchospora pubera]
MGREGEYEKINEQRLQEITIAEAAHLREQAQKQLAEALNIEKKKNDETVEELEKTKGELNKLKQSLAEKESQLKEIEQTSSELNQTQESLNKKEKDYQEVDNSYNKRMEILAKEYEKFRIWIEDQASNSYGMVRFTEFTPQELEAATNDKMNTICLGIGGFGSVYKAVIGKTRFAMKTVSKERESLIKNLEDRLKDKKTFSWGERIKIAASICSALVFLHNTKPNPIAHGDLKPSNILFDVNNVCKLSDFGISRLLNYTNDTITPNHITQLPKGTPFYRDPEFEASGQLTPQSDVYAFGIIMLQLVTGKGPIKIREFVFRKLQTTLDDINLKIFKERTLLQQQKLIEKLLEDAKLVEWPIDVAVKMTSLGLWCSADERKDRPDLMTEVWSEIESMNGFDPNN